MSTLLEQYKKQWGWRNWETLFFKLPQLNDSFIYDLGCAQGDHSKKLSSMGAKVHGLDGNEDLIQYAKQRSIPNSQFDLCDLTKIDFSKLALADGIWTSFVPAYFTNFDKILQNWKTLLKPDGWIAITEMSGLLNHKPMIEEDERLIANFYKDSFERKNYDFESGEKIKSYLENNGFDILDSSFLEDQELSFQGAALNDVVIAWENRFQRMGGLKKFLGSQFESFRDDFISSIKKDEHISNCKVYFHLATIK